MTTVSLHDFLSDTLYYFSAFLFFPFCASSNYHSATLAEYLQSYFREKHPTSADHDAENNIATSSNNRQILVLQSKFLQPTPT
jgi:hypothetical protein